MAPGHGAPSCLIVSAKRASIVFEGPDARGFAAGLTVATGFAAAFFAALLATSAFARVGRAGEDRF